MSINVMKQDISLVYVAIKMEENIDYLEVDRFYPVTENEVSQLTP